MGTIAAAIIKDVIHIKKFAATAAAITKGIIPIKARLTMEVTATIITRENIKAGASFQAFSAVNRR